MENFRELLMQSWSDKNLFIKLTKNKEFVQKLKDETIFLDKNYNNVKNKHRAYVILNGLSKAPLCLCGCGLVANLDQTSPDKGFRKFYNNQHSLEYKKVNLGKEQLYHQRIELQKSVEQIAKDLNTSEISVRNKLKEFDLDTLFDARQRNLNANKILQSNEKLSDMYSSGITIEEISKTLNTSKATVSRWMSIHGIEVRNSNSYERKIKKISNEENGLHDWIKTFYDKKIEQSNRKILNGKELDIFLPEDNLAIEYNGLYSHLYRPWEDIDSKIKDQNYHLNKTIQCGENNIQLLQFYSDEWKYKKEIVKNIIKSKLNLNERIYARKCIISEIKSDLKNKFLNENHIQGEDRSKIKIGLFYENNLVAVMTFCYSRFNKSFNWELSRFASLGGFNIIGGFSKLLKYFINNYGNSIVSYADLRISNGNVYKKNGFKLIRVNKPSYFYVDKNCLQRHNRMKFQKKLINAINCTEYEKARELGYEKIWDCGTLCFGLV